MKARAALALIPLLAVCASGTGLAAPKTKQVCKVVKDAAGDAGFQGVVPGNASDDIVSADLASNATTLTSVVRTAALASPDPESPLGRQYLMVFGTPTGKLLYTVVTTYPQGTSYEFGWRKANELGLYVNYPLGTVKGVVDTAKKEVRMSVPLKAFAASGVKLKAGVKLTELSVESRRVIGQGFVDHDPTDQGLWVGGSRALFDDAQGSGYVVGTPSCVKVGS